MPANAIVTIGTGARAARFGNRLPLALIAGPCALEGLDHALAMAEAIAAITARLNMPFVFKSSFDKANRTSLASPRGLGLEQALAIFAAVKARLGVPVITDVHDASQCAPVAQVVDALQIPAFLCRQTDLLLAAAATGKPVNVKKGQFLAPWDMKNVAAKLVGAGNPNVLVTERGASFGYNTLVSDMRALPIMAETTGAPALAQSAAVAVGVAGVFIETHQDPDSAPSDGPNMVPLGELEALLARLQAHDHIAKGA